MDATQLPLLTLNMFAGMRGLAGFTKAAFRSRW